MAGEKGRGKRSVDQAEHRGGDERGPKIRKVTQEEMGKRKGKLQIKDRDKPMELEKVRRLEEKGKKAAAPEGAAAENAAAADFLKLVTQKKVAFYKTVVEKDYGNMFIKESHFKYYPGGPDKARAVNKTLRWGVKMFKEQAARRLQEYDATGCLAFNLPDAKPSPDFLNRIVSGK